MSQLGRVRLRRCIQINLYSKTNIKIPLELWNEKWKTTRQKIRDKSEYPDREFIKTQLEAIVYLLEEDYYLMEYFNRKHRIWEKKWDSEPRHEPVL